MSVRLACFDKTFNHRCPAHSFQKCSMTMSRVHGACKSVCFSSSMKLLLNQSHCGMASVSCHSSAASFCASARQSPTDSDVTVPNHATDTLLKVNVIQRSTVTNKSRRHVRANVAMTHPVSAYTIDADLGSKDQCTSCRGTLLSQITQLSNPVGLEAAAKAVYRRVGTVVSLDIIVSCSATESVCFCLKACCSSESLHGLRSPLCPLLAATWTSHSTGPSQQAVGPSFVSSEQCLATASPEVKWSVSL